MVLPDHDCTLAIVRYKYEDLKSRYIDPIAIDWPQETLDKWELEERLKRPAFSVVMMSTLRRKFYESRGQRQPRSTRDNNEG